MANVTIVASPAQVQTVATSGQGTQSSASSLPPGSVVSGTITGKDTNGNFLLRTNQGTFALQSNAPLTYNSDVVIRINSASAGGANANIVSVNGEPFAAFSAPEQPTGDTVSPSLLAQVSQTPPENAAAASPPSVQGIIVSAPSAEVQLANALASTPAATSQSAAPDAPATSASLVTGASVVIRVAQTPQLPTQQANVATATAQPVQQPSSTLTPSAVQAQTQGQALSNEQTPVTVAQSTAPQPATNEQQNPSAAVASLPQPSEETATLPSSTTLYAVYTKQQTPAGAAPALSAASSPPATTVQGQVVDTQENGLVTVQTPLGTVTVQADALPPNALAPGASVSIELPASPVAVLAQAVASSVPATLTELAASWQSVSDILSVASAANPASATSLLARLPQLGVDFISSSLSFVSSLVQGDARKVLGDEVADTIQQNGRADLLTKLTGELGSLGDAFAQATVKEQPTWQPLFLPFVYQEEVHQARLYVKRDAPKKERGDAKKSGDTRFVVEVDLSELGPMQMDGLVRKKDHAVSFDLLIRSKTAFSQEEQADIAAIYHSAAQLTGFRGTVAFQVTRDFPVKPLDEIMSGNPHSITV